MNRHRKTAKRRHHFKQYDSTLLFRVLEHKERFCLVEKVLVPPKKKKKIKFENNQDALCIAR